MNKVFFLTGPPLSGKDTQGKLLAKKIKGKFLVNSYFN
jgi:adenylate kinase family enzyme